MPAVDDQPGSRSLRPSVPEGSRPHAVAAALAELADPAASAATSDDVDRVLWAAAQQALPGLPGVTGCGVTVVRDDRPVSIMRDAARFTPLEEIQYAAGVGPVPLALREGRVIAVDATLGRSWPPYASCADELGVRSCLVLPLSAGSEVLGSLNLYATDPDADLRAAQPAALLAADLASTALTAVTRHAAMTKLTEELRTALESRAVIEQAKGLFMARGLSDTEAFAQLRRLSQNHNIKLREVAALVVELSRT